MHYSLSLVSKTIIVYHAPTRVLGHDKASNEDIREWWSRLGAWLSIYAGAWLILALAGVFLPLWMAELVQWAGAKWNATVVLGWIATTVGGLLAGKSASTGNN